jgi:DNA-3-methyladenine glycosylase
MKPDLAAAPSPEGASLTAGLTALTQSDFAISSPDLGRRLLNCLLVREAPEGITIGRITETEAYRPDDPASHAYRGRTARNASMFGPAGHAYVYFTYGMHYCFNVVAAEVGVAEAVLIRALEPLGGLDLMRVRRGIAKAVPDAVRYGRQLCGGPARLCQAFGIDRALDGVELVPATGLWIAEALSPPAAIRATPRIGISVAMDIPWRFTVAGDPYTSRTEPAQA